WLLGQHLLEGLVRPGELFFGLGHPLIPLDDLPPDPLALEAVGQRLEPEPYRLRATREDPCLDERVDSLCQRVVETRDELCHAISIARRYASSSRVLGLGSTSMRRADRPEPGFARREAKRRRPESEGKGGGSWGNHRFPHAGQPVVLPETESWFSACLIRCSSCQRSAVESPASTFASSACAASSCSRARASSISFTETASSTSARARSSSTLKKPGPVANSSTSFAPTCTRVEPALSVATSGACRASTPISPAAPGTISMWASPWKTGPSGVTSSTSNVGWSATSAISRQYGERPSRGRLLHRPRTLDYVLDRADHVEGRLGHVVVLALDDRVEAGDRVLELHVLARRARELLGDEVRLREEPLDLPRPRHDELVLVGELVHPEDRDDVLEILVPLEDLLNARRDAVVVVRDDPRLEGARGRVERVHR